ncbi:MAG: hypothetical protein AAFX56_17885 [Pseudomonadota bacterium]
MRYSLRSIDDEDLDWLYELNKKSFREIVIRQFGTWDEAFQRQSFYANRDSAVSGRIVVNAETRIGVVLLQPKDAYDWESGSSDNLPRS